MSFEDRFPEDPAVARWEHERVRTSKLSPRQDRTGAAASGVEGHPALFRLGFRAMEVPGFPDAVQLGEATLSQTPGPVRTQRTSIQQCPGWRPHFLKRMETVEVGGDSWLTICQLAVTIPRDLTSAMPVWRDQALAATSTVVALLDERIAQEEVIEDLLVLDPAGQNVIAVVDHAERIRTFQAKNRMLPAHRAALAALAPLDLAQENPTLAAGRWYLRAAQAGPTPDSIVFLSIALEALSKPPYRTKLTRPERKRSDVGWIKHALQ